VRQYFPIDVLVIPRGTPTPRVIGLGATDCHQLQLQGSIRLHHLLPTLATTRGQRAPDCLSFLTAVVFVLGSFLIGD